MALELATRYPGRFNPPSAEYPQGSFKNRTAPGALDGSYLERDWANDKEGFFQSLIEEAGIIPDGLVDEVGSSQYYDALLSVIASNATDKLNAPIATIASAATVDLAAGAPNTSQVTITGSVSISAFTVLADRAFVAKFTGACTLVNSGTLVTGTGANIITAAGDSCIIRSTAANTVEIVCGEFLQFKSIGIGQTWQNVKASRAQSVNYTNTTGRPIAVNIANETTWPGSRILLVNGAEVDSIKILSTINMQMWTRSIVPPGATYSYTGAFTAWMELR